MIRALFRKNRLEGTLYIAGMQPPSLTSHLSRSDHVESGLAVDAMHELLDRGTKLSRD